MFKKSQRPIRPIAPKSIRRIDKLRALESWPLSPVLHAPCITGKLAKPMEGPRVFSFRKQQRTVPIGLKLSFAKRQK